MDRGRRVCLSIWQYRRALVVLGAPAVLTAILPYKQDMGLTDKAGNCLYVLLLMACYWTTEAIDIAVTALLPLAFFPLMGVMSAESVAKQYLKDTTTLLIGGFLLAAAIEKCGVQKRIALNMLRLIGSGERTLMMAFMLSTWFISMWISNTASTSIMITIAQSLLVELQESADVLATSQTKATETSMGVVELTDAEGPDTTAVAYSTAVNGTCTKKKEPVTINQSTSEATLISTATVAEGRHSLREQITISSDWLALGKGLSICVAYSATIGGMATLIGSATNIVLVQNLEKIAASHPNVTGVTFASWSVIGLPLSVLLLGLCWLWLQVFFFGFRKCSGDRASSRLLKKFFTNQCEQLGRISFQEVVVSSLLFVLVILWLTRDMGDAGGWGQLFKDQYVKDGTTAISVGLLLFVIPSTLDAFPCLKRRRESVEGSARQPAGPIMTWKEVQQKVPWGIVMLLGGGFALAEGVTGSGLADVIGQLLASSLNGLPDWATVMVMATVTATLTEVTSNVALVTLFLPIVATTAIGIGKNPLYLMFPTCLAASFAFMLPVATPPNAIVFSTGVLKVIDMAKAGVVMNIIGIGAVTFAMTTWGSTYFNLNEWSVGTVVNGSVSLLNSTIPRLASPQTTEPPFA